LFVVTTMIGTKISRTRLLTLTNDQSPL